MLLDNGPKVWLTVRYLGLLEFRHFLQIIFMTFSKGFHKISISKKELIVSLNEISSLSPSMSWTF